MAAVRMGRNVRKAVASVRESAAARPRIPLSGIGDGSAALSRIAVSRPGATLAKELDTSMSTVRGSSCPIGLEEAKFACTDCFPRIGGIGAS
jgi:hypothetical protein